ncbi:hypothetical protein CATMQ487_26250 [Sphaerotilus microaerophilus]|uniref:Transporter n=1 Tax=Sphaerotilus microaerophilus TaxID=2914710 RepID=A0ABM7YMF7_9BURK|nr:hypothetical protein CATMQ487_26250 [Sphaerotilus sp. FB-5]
MRCSLPDSSRLSRLCLVLLPSVLWALPVQAGRPLGTDDAGTAGARTCQVETWFESSQDLRAWTVSPACGLGDAVELGLEFSRPSPGVVAGERHSLGVALKWVDPGWKLGEVQFGLKAHGGTARQLAGGWAAGGRGLLGLASIGLPQQFTLHVNLGDEYDRDARRHRAVAQAALAWQPAPAWLLFGEAQAVRGTGGAQQTLGLRHWLLADTLGLDVTGGRTAGAPGSTVWTVGMGWYGIGY